MIVVAYGLYLQFQMMQPGLKFVSCLVNRVITPRCCCLGASQNKVVHILIVVFAESACWWRSVAPSMEVRGCTSVLGNYSVASRSLFSIQFLEARRWSCGIFDHSINFWYRYLPLNSPSIFDVKLTVLSLVKRLPWFESICCWCVLSYLFKRSFHVTFT